MKKTMEIQFTKHVIQCDRCSELGINLNYVVTPDESGEVIHHMLCSICTLKHSEEFLKKRKE